MMSQALAVAISGVVGVLGRYGVDRTVARLGYHPTLGTLSINFLGCFVVGVIYAFAVQKNALDTSLTAALMIGFCGGLTTFSSYALQGVLLIQQGQWHWSLLYATLSPISGFAAVYLGMGCVRLLVLPN